VIPDRAKFWRIEEALWLGSIHLYGFEEEVRLSDFGGNSL